MAGDVGSTLFIVIIPVDGGETLDGKETLCPQRWQKKEENGQMLEPEHCGVLPVNRGLYY